MNADTMGEFLKSYAEGWFGLKVGQGIVPAKITPRTASSEVLTLQYLTNKGKSTLSKDLVWHGERDLLVRGYPDLGCVKVGPTVGYLRVRPAKQFKKGFVSSNVELFVPNQSQIKKVFPRFVASTTNKELIWQVFDREYFHPLRAVELMDEGEGVGYPLSKNFGLYCDSNHPNLLILYKNRSIGAYKDKTFQLFQTFKDFKEQFQRETAVEAVICPR